MERVVVTGLGTISPIGNNIDEFWASMRANQSGIAPITKFDASSTGVHVAAEVKNFDPSLTMERKEYQRMDFFSQYAVAASVEAINMSGYPLADNAARVGVLVSSGIGGLIEIEKGIRKMIDKGPKRIPPLFVPLTIGNMAAGNISMKLGAKGPSLDIVTACASATNSIGEAFLKIKFGLLDACLAGGCEATINEIGIGGFAALTALSTNEDAATASRPFDKDRDGFVMGEGAGILFLESLSSAQARNATIYAEVVGYGANSDAYHMTAPTPDGSGAGEAMKQAIEMAGIQAEQVDYINAHGTSTPTNDSGETTAIKYALGNHAYKVAVSSSKGHFGHLLGGAGGVEAIVCVKALHDSFVPATLGLQQADEACDLDYVPQAGREQQVNYALSNSLGFGGHNAVLCFKRWEGA
ncbi:beta-ketoacyl-ACP synthase II [Aerococcaceae bacterium NML210727]|nr:beta-ketoacyl-ACP synthase II [Aerococcaceae bacterium NML210727]MCW6655326.1 beta-ketoacyl-ACP synthase II [Aerococcaceae bacterium NML201296]MCW6661975.1 beta-ketoacyl-ACP synthase II [Aerococcaceae bacterium NML201209]MCW6675638.1 beta-ketoacyl-ACP synthase II [Aerococcaceae bacterium NML171108]